MSKYSKIIEHFGTESDLYFLRPLPKVIILVEDKKITSNKKEVPEKLNNVFVEAVANLNIEPCMPEDRDYPPVIT